MEKINSVWEKTKTFILIILMIIASLITIFIAYELVLDFPHYISFSTIKSLADENIGRLLFLVILSMNFGIYFIKKKKNVLIIGILLAILLGGLVCYSGTMFQGGMTTWDVKMS